MASSAQAVRRALRGLDDGLAVFTTQLATEAAELRRNVEQRPCTGATFYRNCLHDLAERLEAVGEELTALEAVSTEAVSLEELVGHSVALYCQNHVQIQELEMQLAQFGYRDLYAPLPPENPLDMLELSSGSGSGRGRATAALLAEEEDAEEEGRYAAYADDAAEGSDAGSPAAAADGEALGEVTNRLAAAQLGERAGDCEASPQAGAPQQQRWVGGSTAPRTTLKAMAPMTAAKALMRADTPSSLASPEAMSPSMRELLGKYAASSAGGGTQPRSSSADLPTASTPGASGGAPPPSPVPSYLSPAFQLAAMEQEVHMAHAAAAAGAAGSPRSGAWEADDAMYSALQNTARKLAGKPSFMEAYRQKFPAIVASTERLLQTVEKQRRPAATAAVAAEEAAAGPVAALALAVQAAAGGGYGGSVAGAQQHQRQHQQQGSMDEDSTMDLMSQVLGRRGADGAADEPTEDISGAAAALGSTRFAVVAASPPPPARLAQPPSTAALLSRALGGNGTAAAAAGGDHPINSRRAEPQQPAPAAPPSAALATVQQSAQRSKPQLEEAIAAALGRSTAPVAPSGAGPPAPTPAAAPALAVQPTRSVPPAAPPAAPAAKPAAPLPTPLAPAVPPSVLRACPPPPPAPAAANAATPAAPVAVPALRPVEEGEYTALPTFIRSQLSLEALNATLAAVHSVAAARSSGFAMEDMEAAAGLGAKCKVVVNSLVKLGRVQLQVARGGSATTYLLL